MRGASVPKMDTDTKMFNTVEQVRDGMEKSSNIDERIILHRHHDHDVGQADLALSPRHSDPHLWAAPPNHTHTPRQDPNELMLRTKIGRTKGKAKTLIVIKVGWVQVCSRTQKVDQSFVRAAATACPLKQKKEFVIQQLTQEKSIAQQGRSHMRSRKSKQPGTEVYFVVDQTDKSTSKTTQIFDSHQTCALRKHTTRNSWVLKK